MTVSFEGVTAALLTPVDDRGQAYPPALPTVIDFVLERGVRGICLGGGTSEYPHFSLDERKRLLVTAAQHVPDEVALIAAIGASTPTDVLDLGRHALEAGCDALLLPAPHFYRYEQQDLDAFFRAVAEALPAPILLYNLAGFTGNPIDPATSVRLMTEVDTIVGLKDSSGNREAIQPLAEARASASSSFTLLGGNDGLFHPVLQHGWDGCISGIASCCPEMLVAVDEAHRSGDDQAAAQAQAVLDAFIRKVDALPFPWVIRLAADLRGLPVGSLGWPLSAGRVRQFDALRRDLPGWFDEHLTVAPPQA